MIPEEYNGLTTKPELSEELLMHYGVPGMKWGVRKARPVSLGLRRRGTASSGKVVKSRPKAKKVTTKGYSKKQYDKYRSQGMSHTQAEAAAKEHRKKVVAGVVVGAAALSLTALAAHKLRNTSFRSSESQAQMFERRRKAAVKKSDYKNYKFRTQGEYNMARSEALRRKASMDQAKGIHRQKGYTYKVSENEIKKMAQEIKDNTKHLKLKGKVNYYRTVYSPKTAKRYQGAFARAR